MPRVRLAQVTKQFTREVIALRDVSFEIAAGELLVLVGPSGCGKSTTLRIIAGLESATSGQIYFDGQEVSQWPATDRRVGMVFQGENLFPHLDVWDNLAIALRMRRVARRRIESQVDAIMDRLDLRELATRWPQELSGGERQRVALGRVLASDAEVCLLDEPLANLDPVRRDSLRDVIREAQRASGRTTLLVTHDQAEAMSLGQRIGVMQDGAIAQLGTPEHVYRHPANLFVARFLGSPSMNLLSGEIQASQLRWAGQVHNLPASLPSGPVWVGIRPEQLGVVDHVHPFRLPGVVRATEFRGHGRLTHVQVGADRITAWRRIEISDPVGEALTLGYDFDDLRLFTTEPSGRALQLGDPPGLA